jgi:hypothetical protein
MMSRCNETNPFERAAQESERFREADSEEKTAKRGEGLGCYVMVFI